MMQVYEFSEDVGQNNDVLLLIAFTIQLACYVHVDRMPGYAGLRYRMQFGLYLT